jgi:hypothetical protein
VVCSRCRICDPARLRRYRAEPEGRCSSRRAAIGRLPGGGLALGSQGVFLHAADLACSGTVDDECAEHLAHRFGIAAHDRGGGFDVADRIKMLPGERESGVAGKLPEEGPLRAPVTRAERMQGVDLAR